MSKYNSEMRQQMLTIETEKKGTGNTYFSAKGGENDFSICKDRVLKVVDIQPVAGEHPHNVVMFDDGHQMSTSRFFTAKGIKWPVGGNRGKLTYLVSALETGKELKVTPESCSSDYIRNAKNQYYVRPENGEASWVDATGDDAPENAVKADTYVFKPVSFPTVELVDMEAED